ncbi:hypothetical protein NL529_28355, partial [Klebsiella pneumoniae]|nr:hypothetical protein [Klebsiella pneumoniae]
HVWHRFDQQVTDVKQVGHNRIIATSKDIECLSAEAEVLWTRDFDCQQWIAGGGLIELPNGSWLAFSVGRISDSGVQLVRFDSADGRILWKR